MIEYTQLRIIQSKLLMTLQSHEHTQGNVQPIKWLNIVRRGVHTSKSIQQIIAANSGKSEKYNICLSPHTEVLLSEIILVPLTGK